MRGLTGPLALRTAQQGAYRNLTPLAGMRAGTGLPGRIVHPTPTCAFSALANAATVQCEPTGPST